MAVSLVLSALLQAAAVSAPTAQTLARIDAYFRTEVERAGFPGGSLAIVQGDQLILTSSVGVADLEARRPVTPDTVFWIGSVTKSFTATALLQLRDQGLVDLDAPVTRYLPWFRVADEGLADRITLRELLNHTSGLPTNSHAVVWQDEDAIRNSIDKAVRALREVHLHGAPGTRFEYANMNYVVLGRVIEAVAGTSWDQYVTKHIFIPAGMIHSAVHPADLDPLRIARPYLPEFGRLAEIPVQVGDFLAPASNILSTAPDLARFAAAHLGTGARLLSPASLLESHSSGVEMAPGKTYAYGWIRERFDGVTIVHHGGAAGHAADIYLVPERHLAVAVLFGAYSHTENDRIAEGVVALALGREPPPVEGPSELGVLMWVDRSVFGVTLACPATLGILPVVRRRRRRHWGRRALVARAGLLAGLAGALWFVTFHVVPQNIPEFPLPFGFHGWTQDVAVAAIAVLLTSTAWALWGVATIFRRARSIAALSTEVG